LRGAGRTEDARDLEVRGTTVTMAFGLIFGIASAVVLRLVGGPPLAKAALFLVLVIFLQQRFTAGTTVLRARRRFGSLALVQLAYALVYLVGLLILLRDYYLTGALAAGAAGFLVAVALSVRSAPDVLGAPRLGHLRRLRPLIARGLPLYGVHVTFAIALQADRVVVGAVLGREALGLYGVLVIGGTALLFVPDAFSGVLWPFAGERFGRHRMRPESLRPLARRTLLQLALLLVGLLPATLGAIDVLVARVLPGFEPALPALRIYGISIFLLAVALPLRNLAMTVGGGPSLLRLQTGILVALFALQGAAAATGLGLVGVAAAGAVVWAAQLTGILVLLARAGVLTSGDALGLGLRVAGLTTLAACLDASIAALAPGPTGVPGAILRVGAPLAGAAVFGTIVALRARRDG
jgi:O-antigen/teichoic acid export membrane protein